MLPKHLWIYIINFWMQMSSKNLFRLLLQANSTSHLWGIFFVFSFLFFLYELQELPSGKDLSPDNIKIHIIKRHSGSKQQPHTKTLVKFVCSTEQYFYDFSKSYYKANNLHNVLISNLKENGRICFISP